MKLLFVPLDPAELDALQTVARAERRRPQEQAAVLLGEALAQRRNTPALGGSDSANSQWRQPPLFGDWENEGEVDA
jgi:hypothetical protein